MRLTTKCRYGARAVIEIARNCGKYPVKRKDIAKNQELSDSYLENILIILKNNGIIKTIRGAKGGYILQRPASEINFLDLVIALQGSIVPVDCLDDESVCNRTDFCSIRKIWRKLQVNQEKILSDITVQMLIDEEKATEEINYSI